MFVPSRASARAAQTISDRAPPRVLILPRELRESLSMIHYCGGDPVGSYDDGADWGSEAVFQVKAMTDINTAPLAQDPYLADIGRLQRWLAAIADRDSRSPEQIIGYNDFGLFT